MRSLRLCLTLFSCLISASTMAKADTVYFTATVTQQNGLSVVPIGTTYTGWAHYAGTYVPGTEPPPLDSYGFSYPSAPADLGDMKWAWVLRHTDQDPIIVALAYIDFSSPAASWDVIGPGFAIFTPTGETSNGFSYSKNESGTVTYTYATDPVATTPEPASFGLLGTGLAVCFGLVRKRLPGRS